MRLIEWEVSEDGYEEQIVIPKEKRDLAAGEGIDTEYKQCSRIQEKSESRSSAGEEGEVHRAWREAQRASMEGKG